MLHLWWWLLLLLLLLLLLDARALTKDPGCLASGFCSKDLGCLASGCFLFFVVVVFVGGVVVALSTLDAWLQVVGVLVVVVVVVVVAGGVIVAC